MKRSITIAGHATSISLEPAFWVALEEIAGLNNQPIAALIRQIDEARAADTADSYSLSSHIRVYILKHFRDMIPSNNSGG
ncbi:MAG: ribbon-helix-helix domain-containing protein [Alphaproteobacteria bacterium]